MKSDSQTIVARTKVILVSVMLLGLLIRLAFLYGTDFVIDSDEAIVGLMAKHILEGRNWPIFYYGQDYMGSLEAILTTIPFAIIGVTSLALKIVPLLFSIIHILLVYALSRKFVDRTSALCAAFLCAAAPITLVLWSAKARGGFIEVVVLGTAALLLSCDLLEEKARTIKAERLKLIGLGLCLGAGWWVNNQISYYMLPIGVVVGVSLIRRNGFVQGLLQGLTCLASFLIGGAPFWIANIFGSPKWATFEVLFGGSGEVDVMAHLSGYFSDALPIIMGARRFWSEADTFSSATLFFYCLYGASFVASVFAFFRWPKKRAQLLLIFGFLLSVTLIFSTSRFGWLSSAPRYILPLYSINFVLIAIAVQMLRTTALSSFVLPIVGLAALAQLSPMFLSPGITLGQPFVYGGERVSKNQAPLYDWLEKEGYNHIFTNYWIGYRAAFETEEKITFSRFSVPLTLRIPEYEQQAPETPSVFVLVPSQLPGFTNRLDQVGIGYRISRVGEYAVVDQLREKWSADVELEITPEMLSSSQKAELAELAVDDDLGSRWGSGMPQAPGMYFEIAFPSATLVSGLEIDFGSFAHDAPQHFRLVGELQDGSIVGLVDLGTYRGVRGFAELGDLQWRFLFEPRLFTKLRLEQLGEHSLFDWSIAELRLFQPSKQL